MMSAYTIFKALDLKHLDMKSPVRVSEEALAQPPSKMGLPIGTILNIETALKIIMVKSANDISVALAQAISGSEEQFVSLIRNLLILMGCMILNNIHQQEIWRF
jgi:D-alanyl-D-alanine carboxypeptidase